MPKLCTLLFEVTFAYGKKMHNLQFESHLQEMNALWKLKDVKCFVRCDGKRNWETFLNHFSHYNADAPYQQTARHFTNIVLSSNLVGLYLPFLGHQIHEQSLPPAHAAAEDRTRDEKDFPPPRSTCAQEHSTSEHYPQKSGSFATWTRISPVFGTQAIQTNQRSAVNTFKIAIMKIPNLLFGDLQRLQHNFSE